MSEVFETPSRATSKEAPLITLTETATGIALKTLIPSAAHAREELDKYKAWKFAHSLGAVLEIAGIEETIRGKDWGPALWVAGKISSFTAEAIAVRKAMKEKTTTTPPAKGTEGEPVIIKLPSKAAGIAAKVLLPSFISAGKIEQKGYRFLVETAKGLEIVGTASAIYAGKPEIAAGTYLGGRTLALFAEAADNAMPRVKDKLRRLKQKNWSKVKRFGEAIERGAKWVGKETGQRISEVQQIVAPKLSRAGLSAQIRLKEVGRKSATRISEASKVARRRLKEKLPQRSQIETQDKATPTSDNSEVEIAPNTSGGGGEE